MIGGVILAAGAGRRFGSAKQLADLDGRPLLGHAVRAMSAVPAIERIVVVLGANADEIRGRVDLLDAEPLVSREWDEGIAASLRTGVAELSAAEAVVVTLGDQPTITPQVIAGVLDHRDGERPAVRATYNGQPGHPVVLERRLFPTVGRLRGDTGARDLLVNVDVREWECGHLCRADDVDTPDELQALRS